MKIGIIGLGSIGLRHANNLKELGHRVISYDPDLSKNPTHLTRNEVIKESDAIVIASPTDCHEDDIYECEANDKPYFVEKPIKHILTDTIGKNALMVGCNLRFRSCIIAAKEWINIIGQPIWSNFTVSQYNDKYIDSVILNWGAHEIDLALYLLGSGRVTGCSARSSNGRDDLADITFTHDNGCRTAIHLDYLTKPEVRQFIIVGSQATIIVDVVHNQAWLRGADETIWDHSEEVDSFDDNYKDEMRAFLDRIDGKETIGCTGNEALDVLKICLEAIKQAGLS